MPESLLTAIIALVAVVVGVRLGRRRARPRPASPDTQPDTPPVLFDDLPVGVFRSTLDGEHLLYANTSLAHLFGWPDAGAMIEGQTPRDLYASPTARDDILQRLQQAGEMTTDVIHLQRPGHAQRACILHLRIDNAMKTIEGWVMDVTELDHRKEELRDAHRFLQNVVDALPCPLFFKDMNGAYTLFNHAFSDMRGLTPENLQGKNADDIAPPDLAAVYHSMDQALLDAKGPASQRYESAFTTPHGLRHVLFDKATVVDDEGTARGLVGIITDITGRKQAEDALRRVEARIRALVHNASDGFFSVTPEGYITESNPAMCKLLGLKVAPSSGERGELTCVAPDDDEASDANRAQNILNLPDMFAEGREAWDAALHRLGTGAPPAPFEVRVRRDDGQTVWLSLALWPVDSVPEEDGPPPAVEGMAHDITAHKLAEMDLTRRIVTDPLTGLFNRAHMEDMLPRMLARAAEDGRTLGLLFIDLDGFKAVNDTYGHAVGDTLLQQVAGRLRRRLRHTDIAIRLGGDEFAVLLWDVAGKEAVERIGAGILSIMAPAFTCTDIPCSVSASIGASLYPQHADDAPSLLRLADEAMYRAKAEGKNRMAFAGPSRAGD